MINLNVSMGIWWFMISISTPEPLWKYVRQSKKEIKLKVFKEYSIIVEPGERNQTVFVHCEIEGWLKTSAYAAAPVSRTDMIFP